jgi:hypothetical protein
LSKEDIITSEELRLGRCFARGYAPDGSKP